MTVSDIPSCFRPRRRIFLSFLLFAFFVFGGMMAVAQISVKVVDKELDLPEQPLTFLDKGRRDLSGSLLYLASVHFPGGDGRTPFLVTKHIGKTVSGDSMFKIDIPRRQPLILFDSRFSEDGRYIVFKAGWPYDDPGHYKIYLWDIQKNQLLNGPTDDHLSYRWLRLSSNNDYLAFCKGGNNNGDESGPGGSTPLNLCIFDLRNNTERSISVNPAARNSVWTKQGKLLFTLIDQGRWRRESQGTSSGPKGNELANPARDLSLKSTANFAARPDVYEIDPKEESPKLLFHDGYRPSPSPNGRWIACFTSTDEDKKVTPAGLFNPNIPVHSYLCLYDRTINKRIVIRPTRVEFPSLIWTPDSKQLIVVGQRYQGATGTASIESIPIETLHSKAIAKVVSTDFEPASRDFVETQFQTLRITNNESHLLLTASKYTDQGRLFVNEIKSLVSINLDTGKVETVAEIANKQANSLGLDWFDTSVLARENN